MSHQNKIDSYISYFPNNISFQLFSWLFQTYSLPVLNSYYFGSISGYPFFGKSTLRTIAFFGALTNLNFQPDFRFHPVFRFGLLLDVHCLSLYQSQRLKMTQVQIGPKYRNAWVFTYILLFWFVLFDSPIVFLLLFRHFSKISKFLKVFQV